MKIYLSHPYGGKLENRIKAARLARVYREIWDAEGKEDFEIVNPLEELRGLAGKKTEEEILQEAIKLMKTCDAVFFAPGWQASNGCLKEHAAALLHMPMYHIPSGLVA